MVFFQKIKKGFLQRTVKGKEFASEPMPPVSHDLNFPNSPVRTRMPAVPYADRLELIRHAHNGLIVGSYTQCFSFIA